MQLISILLQFDDASQSTPDENVPKKERFGTWLDSLYRKHRKRFWNQKQQDEDDNQRKRRR